MDLTEGDIFAVSKPVSGVLVGGDGGILFVGNVADEAKFQSLSILVINGVGFSKVYKAVGVETH